MAMYKNACNCKSIPVVYEIIKSDAAKRKIAVVDCLIHLVQIGVGIFQESIAVCSSAGNRFPLAIIRVGKKIDFSLAYVDIATTIKFSAHVNTSPDITIIPSFTIFLQNNI